MKKDGKEWNLRKQRDARNIKKLLKRVLEEGSVCVDVGSHRGSFLKKFLKHSPEGHHMAFEPIPKLAERLKKIFPMVEIFECALGDEIDIKPFYYVPELTGWSGLKKQWYPKEVNPEVIKVEVRTLDSVISRKIDFIKIDVEGAEFEVLRGGINVIKKYMPVILFEHAYIHNIDYYTTPERVFNLLVNEYDMNIFTLNMFGPLSLNKFVAIYEMAFKMEYDRYAETNFVAMSQELN